MSAYDLFHQAVRNALVKDGWNITHDPLRVPFGDGELLIDLGAELLIGARREGQEIAVEVKSFVGSSVVSEFHTALGQFLNYRIALEYDQPERVLYLAIPGKTFALLQQNPLIRKQLERLEVRVMTYDPRLEVIEQWTS